MRVRSIITGIFLFCSLILSQAQTPDSLVRKETIAQARYLKSIFKTDEAIE